jgi:hypothetical protein
VAPESPCKELNQQTSCIVEISPHSDYVGCMQRADPLTSKQKVYLPSKIRDSLTLPLSLQFLCHVRARCNSTFLDFTRSSFGQSSGNFAGRIAGRLAG